ncbi:dephospho-CoA kinase [Thiohalobacter sp. COW1]|uniref:Dephospho-CoA kinase n=1 Tax=Thiohalobacter thiocyanaticus TaxID=585455 RepID=A0A1Z4VTQ5_9GAMM|nr:MULTISPECIES: dephospho-CoA kinase [Thiohalobacter]BAZ95021.1 dephospho-CoA kinase [Thiohalobacter thiocyanaticus]BCO33062.1 dephospho-CoA kinase [Thiohalobacter sp. COW1]
MLKIGLTGGIACGKSTVAAGFAELGVPVIDADVIARELVEPGEPALAEIARELGQAFIAADGRLDRVRLRDHVFRDPMARKRLEAILHPRIAAEMQARADRLDTPYCLLVIPLLLEAGQQSLVDRILVVDCPEVLQRARLAERDDADPEQISAILASQLERERRLAAADDILCNDGTPEQLRDRIDGLHARYLTLAEQAGSRRPE